MHVHPEHQLAAGHVLEHVDQHPVAVAGGDLLVLEQRERVRARRAEAHPARAGALAGVAAQRAKVGVRLVDVLADDGARLEHALHQLRLEPVGELAAGGVVEQRLDAAGEVERVGVEEHVLLLHADRQRRPGAELVVEHARPGGAALAGALPWGLRSHWAVSTGNRAEREGPVRSAQLEYQPKWRNWQTRGTQNPVPARACGFDPHLRHSLATGRSAAARSTDRCCRRRRTSGTSHATRPAEPSWRRGERRRVTTPSTTGVAPRSGVVTSIPNRCVPLGET